MARRLRYANQYPQGRGITESLWGSMERLVQAPLPHLAR